MEELKKKKQKQKPTDTPTGVTDKAQERENMDDGSDPFIEQMAKVNMGANIGDEAGARTPIDVDDDGKEQGVGQVGEKEQLRGEEFVRDLSKLLPSTDGGAQFEKHPVPEGAAGVGDTSATSISSEAVLTLKSGKSKSVLQLAGLGMQNAKVRFGQSVSSMMHRTKSKSDKSKPEKRKKAIRESEKMTKSDKDRKRRAEKESKETTNDSPTPLTPSPSNSADR